MRSRRRARDPGESATLAAAQAAAFDDARALALEIGRGVPSRHFDAVRAGLVLTPGEAAYRCVGAWLVVQDCGSWAPSNWAQVLITDQRLLCRPDDGRLHSLPWAAVTGLQIALDQQRLFVNYVDHAPIAFMGVQSVALAVAAVAGVYGTPSLLTHPSLSLLRHPNSTVGHHGS